MISILKKADCCGCSACAAACPRHCIHMRADAEGFLYPEVEKEKCVDCSLCKTVCPVLNPVPERDTVAAWAARANSVELLSHSSSGGIFSLFANNIWESGGVVCGAWFNNNWQLEHGIATSPCELPRLQGSKYIQSNMNECFLQIKNVLEKNIPVFFVGTPCQVGGLKSFLRKEYDKLYTADLICHGTPSPAVWARYLQEKLTKAGVNLSDVKQIHFRNKDHGWHQYSLKIKCEGGKSIASLNRDDLFLRGFIANLFLRPSCAECRFKGHKSFADITLGDFWNISEIIPAWEDDNSGVSAILAHTKKGVDFFEKINCEKQTSAEAVIYRRNSALFCVSKPHPRRRTFFREFERNCIAELIEKLLRPTLLLRVKIKIRRLIRWGIK